MRLILATAFLIVGSVLVRDNALMILGCLLLAWVPTLIVEHMTRTVLWVPRHPPTLDELLTFDDEPPTTADQSTRDDS